MLGVYTRTLTSFNKVQLFKLFKTKRHKKLSTWTSLYSQYNLKFSHTFLNNLKLYSTKLSPGERVFIDYENTYIHNILQTIPVVDCELFSFKSVDKIVTTLDDFDQVLDQNWRSKTASEIVYAFKSLSSFCSDNRINVSDTRFDKLVDGLMDHVQDLSDHELSDLLTCLSKYPPCDSITSHNFHDIWSALDDVCCWRISGWTRETWFWFAELWYKFNLGNILDFMYMFLHRMDKKTDRLTKDQLLHVLFYAKIQKRNELPFAYQSQLDGFISGMSLDEVCVAATTLAKNNIRPRFVSTCEKMITKLKTNLPVAEDLCISNIVQVLRYSSSPLLVDQLTDLLDHLVPEIDRLSIISCTHVALLGTTLQFFHKQSLTKVCEKLLQNIDKTRIKDLERLLVALSMFDFDPKTTPDIFTTILDELHKQERIAESIKYKRCLPCALNFLSIKNLYSNELMDRIFHPDHILEVYGKRPRSLSHDIFALDISRDIECPDYNGNRLDKEFRRNVTKWYVEYVPSWDQPRKLLWTDKYALDVADTVSTIVHGPENIYCGHLLPNYVKPDIVFCKDSNGRFVKPIGFKQYTLGDIMYPPNKSFTWYAVVPLNWNMTIRNTVQPLGLYNAKYRQLKAIGYEPIFVISNEFTLLNREEKINYIVNKIR